ncbi:MAG: aldo/keto reductase [Armatimonadota bacterium]
MDLRLAPARTLGRTGVQVPLVGYGTAPLGKKWFKGDATRCLNHAIDRGITYLDTSPDYGSEPYVGEVMKTRRDEVFLATKVNNRRKETVLDEIKESLKKLQTHYVDLIQVHAVNAFADLEMALAEDGTLAALEQARDEGLVRYIGITGHARPEILAEALRKYPFDTVLVAIGMADRLVTAPDRFLLPVAREKNAGVIAMKVLGHGEFPNVNLALRYSLGLEGVSLAIVGMDNTDQIDEIVEIAANYTPLSESEEAQLIEQVKPLVQKDYEESQKGAGSLFWLHDSNVMGWKQQDEPALVNY